MKKLLILLISALTLLAAAVPAAASDACVYDMYGLFSDEERGALETRAQAVSSRYGCGVYLVVVDDYGAYGSSAASAAENIYRDNGFGRYEDSSGILLLLSMSERDCYVYHLGFGTYAAERWGASRIDSSMLNEFRYDRWYDGCAAFIDTCAAMLADAESSYDPADYDPDGTPARQRAGWGFCIAVGLIVGCVAGFIAASSARSSMRSVRAASSAYAYAAEGLELYQSDDRFSHVTESRVRIESGSSRGSGGGGGRPSGGEGGHGGTF